MAMTQKRWEHFAHGSDIGVRGVGGSKEEAFEQAAFALTAVITDPESVVPSELVELTCEAPDEELLLADWLNTLVYEMATRHMLFGRFEVQIHGETLRAKAWGEKIDALKHQPAAEVKGATYTQLKVYRGSNISWVAQGVVDV